MHFKSPLISIETILKQILRSNSSSSTALSLISHPSTISRQFLGCLHQTQQLPIHRFVQCTKPLSCASRLTLLLSKTSFLFSGSPLASELQQQLPTLSSTPQLRCFKSLTAHYSLLFSAQYAASLHSRRFARFRSRPRRN